MVGHAMLRAGAWHMLFLLSGAAGTAARAQSADYTFHVFKAARKMSQTLVAKNAAGAKLFQIEPSGGVSSCLLMQGKSRIVIRDPGGALTQCTGLGSNGGVVGWYGAANAMPPYTGFAYLNGAYADVVPGATNPVWGSTVNAVSPNGLMAGMYLASDNSYPIFLTYGSTYTYVEQSGVTILDATGVNDDGVLVAQEVFDTLWGEQVNSVLIVDGAGSPIAFPGAGGATLAHAINDKGDVVGYYYDAQEVPHGFLYSSTKNAYFGPIDVPGAAQTVLVGITKDDQVTGTAVFPGSETSQAVIGYPASRH
jgi:probable HAF family extracellular repeat protein